MGCGSSTQAAAALANGTPKPESSSIKTMIAQKSKRMVSSAEESSDLREKELQEKEARLKHWEAELAAKEKALAERGLPSMFHVTERKGNDVAVKEVSTLDKSRQMMSINYSAASRAKLPPLGASDGVFSSHGTSTLGRRQTNVPFEKSMAECRELIDLEDPEEIENLVEAGLLHEVVSSLSEEEVEEVQLDAAYIATILTMPVSDYIEATVEHGVIPPLVKLMNSESDEVVDQALSALSNIVGDSTILRDAVVSSRAIETLVDIMPGRTMSTAQNGVWFISNLVKIKPLPNLQTMSQLIHILTEIMAIRDPDSMSAACWALASITDLGDDSDVETLSMVVGSEIIPAVLEAAKSTDMDVAVPCVKTLGNGLSGSDEDTDRLLKAGVLDTLLHILQSDAGGSVLKEAAWAVSNVAAGTEEQLQTLLEKPGMIKQLVTIIRSERYSAPVKKECAWVLSNATHGATHQIALLVAQDVLRALAQTLDMDKKMQAVGLEAIQYILLAGEEDADELGYNPYSKLMDALGVFNSIQGLALDPEHSVTVAEIQDTFIEDWSQYKDEHAEEFGTDPEMEQAAVKLQAMARGRKSRKVVEELRGEQAAANLNDELIGLPPATKKKSTLPALPETPSAPLSGDATAPSDGLTAIPEDQELNMPIGDGEDEQAAAMKIQALQRGRKARREVANLKASSGSGEATTASQVAVEAAVAVATGGDPDEEAAAMKIQAMQRGRQARRDVEAMKEQKEQEEAAVKLQALQRGRQARKALKEGGSEKRSRSGADED